MTVVTRELIEREVYEIRDGAFNRDRPMARTSRLTIARQVALIVARFVGDGKMAAWIVMGAADLDHPVYVDAIENYVRAHADEALGGDLEPGSTYRGLLVPLLDSLGLYEDFDRIRRGDQWMAFDGSEG